MGKMRLGGTEIKKAYLGSTVVKKIYLGATQIWANATPAPGRIQLSANVLVTTTWSKLPGMVASADYPDTTIISNDSLIVPATGSYTLTGGAIYTAGLGNQLSRAVLQNGTVLSADASGSTPSVIPTVTVSLTEGDQISLEAQSSFNNASYQTVAANVNTFLQIVPV